MPQKKTKSKKALVKRSRGQPTKYDPKYCQKIIDYFTQEAYEQIVTKVIRKTNGDKIECYGIRAKDPKFINQFAKSIGVCKDTLMEWADKNDDFSSALAEAKILQKIHIIINALQGTYSASFSKFAMKNMFAWRDKELYINVDESTHYTSVIQQLHDLTKAKDPKLIKEDVIDVGGEVRQDTNEDGSHDAGNRLAVIR